MLAWYEPWKTDFSSNGTINITHKPVADDIFRQLYPSKILVSESIRQFQIPLWNPYNGSGMPFFATMHIGFLNPFNLLLLFFPKYIGWGIFVAIQPTLISFFTYLYCRKIGIKFIGALFSGIVFVFSGTVIVRLLFGEYAYGLWILPMLLYLLESFFENPNSKKGLIIPFSIALLFISGQPQIIAYVLVFSSLYFFYRLFQIKKESKKLSINSILSIPVLVLIGVGLIGIQLLPTIELFGQASISPSSSKFIFDRFLLPVQHLLGIFIPNYFGNQATYNYWGSGDYIETVASIGLIPCFFAFISLGKLKNKIIDLRNFYYISIILSILLTLDWFFTRILFSVPIPIFSTGIPSRIFGITSFCIAIIAGYGFDKWINLNRRDFGSIKKQVIIYASLVSAIFIGTFIFYALRISCNNEFILNCGTIALRTTTLEAISFIIALILFVLPIILDKKRVLKISSVGILLIVVGLGVYNSDKFLPFSKKEAILPQNDLISQLQKIKDFRVFGLGEANIKTNFATYYKFYDPNYYDPLYNKRYGELIDFANKGKLNVVLPRSDVEIANDPNLKDDALKRRERLFDILSVKYLILKKSSLKPPGLEDIFWQNKNWIIKNNESLPPSYFVNKIEVISDKNAILKRLFDSSFNPGQTVILETDPHMLSTDRISIVSDNYYPGWKAYIDGKETKIYRANYTFRAIVLPKGNHQIRFSYEPESLRVGTLISLSSLGILMLIAIRTFRAKNKQS